MQFDSPILFELSLLLPVWLLIFGWKLRVLAKISLVLAMLCGCCVIGGLRLHQKRDLNIIALVDVSPSTRGALFRKLDWILQRQAHLTGNHDIPVKYFASGITQGSDEVMVNETVLPPIDADAVLLFSDGQFDLPNSFPACYPVIDPQLINPEDARITSIQFEDQLANIFTFGKLENRTMSVDSASPSFFNPNSISGLSVVKPDGNKIRATLNSFDAWPENDKMTAVRIKPGSAKPLIVAAASDLPKEISDYLNPSAIVIPPKVVLSPVQLKQISDYVNTLGGSLVLNGATEDFQPEIRQMAPVTHLPPQQRARWVFMLDASGSMGTKIGDKTRWQSAIAALRSALVRIDDEESVSLITFNQKINTIVENVRKADLEKYLRKLSAIVPTGATGLQSAIENSLLGAPTIPTRLIILSDGDADLKDQGKLILQLIKKQWTVNLLATGENDPNPEIVQLCQSTGGIVSQEKTPINWPTASSSLVRQVINNQPFLITATIQSTDQFEDIHITAKLGYSANLKNGAKAIARTSEKPIVASWNVGFGKISSILADIDDSTTYQIVSRLTRAPSNPNYQIEIDYQKDELIVRLQSGSQGKADVITLERTTGSDTQKSTLAIESPGVYKTSLPRLEQPSVLVISANDQVIERRPFPGHYPIEYDHIGLNRDTLDKLAARTRGKVIEPEDNNRIQFANTEHWKDLSSYFAIGAFAFISIGLILIRSPLLFSKK